MECCYTDTLGHSEDNDKGRETPPNCFIMTAINGGKRKECVSRTSIEDTAAAAFLLPCSWPLPKRIL